MFGFGENTKLPQFLVEFLHERGNARTDRTEVMVFHLLTLGRLCAEQRAAGEDQILAFGIVITVNQEILLLGANRCSYAADILAEQLENPACLVADRLHRTEQRGLFVQNLTRIRAECGRDVQGTIFDKCIARRIPRGVSARFKCRAQAAGRERGSVRLAFDQFFAGEFHHDPTVIGRGDERVMLLRGNAGQRLEPVRIMSRTLAQRPVLHCSRHHSGNVCINGCALAHRLLELAVDVLGQTLLHHGLVKDHAAEQLRNIFCSVHGWFAPYIY